MLAIAVYGSWAVLIVALTIIACECYVDRTGEHSGEVMSKDEDEPSREIAVCGLSRHAEGAG